MCEDYRPCSHGQRGLDGGCTENDEAVGVNAAIIKMLIDYWAIAKNGSSRYFSGQKRVYLNTIATESVFGRI